MTSFGIRIPVLWIKSIRTQAMQQQTDQSKVARQLLAAGAEALGIELNHY